MNIKDSNLTINVMDMDKSIAFYQSIGLTLKNRWGNYYALITSPGLSIGLHPSTNLPGNSGNLSIGFTTDNFEAVQSTLSGLSINATVREEEGGKFLHFADPDGTALYFIKPKWG